MKIWKTILIGALIILAYYNLGNTSITGFVTNSDMDSITIANWNVQVFGISKWDKPDARTIIIDKADDYDILFIQEIRDKSGLAFEELCAEVRATHDCVVSSRAGATTSKEQIGVIYSRSIQVTDIIDYNIPEHQDDFNRPPYQVQFTVNEYSFDVFSVHVDPDNVDKELDALEAIVAQEGGRVLIVGDLNADGRYYDEDTKTHFSEYTWIIPDSADTTVAASDNTYDRIIASWQMNRRIVDWGVDTQGITDVVSDHYIVWAEVNV